MDESGFDGENYSIWDKDNNTIQSVAYVELVPLLIKAIQELSTKVEELESKLNQWYNSKMSRISKQEQQKTGIMEISQSDINDSNLDVNLVIAVFQEKLSSLMTDLVIKEATIKQQSIIIQRLKGQM